MEDSVEHSAPQQEGHQDKPENPQRRALIALALATIITTGCDKFDRVLNGPKATPKSPPAAAPGPSGGGAARPAAPTTPPRDPNRPEFLDEDALELHGLALMLNNSDIFDRFAFNAVTGDRSFGKTMYVQKGYEFNFPGRAYEMPYHAFLFKPFDKRSNFLLPERLGKHKHDTTMAGIINSATSHRADNPKDIEAIKVIVATSYEFNYGIKLDPDHIKVIPAGDGSVSAIKYTAPNARKLGVDATIATRLEQDEQNKERTHAVATKDKRWTIVNRRGELYFPHTVMSDMGIPIPVSSLPEVKTIKYSKRFETQGKTVSINLNLPIDNVLEEQDKLSAQGRPQTFPIDSHTISANPGYYILDKDPLVKKLAEIITRGFRTKRQKLQSILDFVHSYDYVPDAFGEAPRSPFVSLISGGGDCEDSTILLVALTRAVGIESIFVHFGGHLAPASDIGGPGSAMSWGGKNFEWAETTGGEEAVVTVTSYKDPYTGRVVRTERTARPWGIGEKPDKYGSPRFVSRINSNKLTPMGRSSR